MQKGIGKRIRDARKAAGLTQEELAERMGTSSVAVAQWETGRRNPKMGTVSKLAAALGVDVAELVPELKTLLKEKPEPPKIKPIFEDNGFLTARMTAIQKRAYEIYNLYGTIRRVLFEGRKEERANALSQLIQQQGGNVGGKADPNSPEELETMKQQLAEIDKLEEVVLFKDDTGKIRWVRLNGEKWL